MPEDKAQQRADAIFARRRAEEECHCWYADSDGRCAYHNKPGAIQGKG